MIEGSGSGTRSGSIPLTNGSGSGSGSRSRRPKNTWIRWIHRIRIRNTAAQRWLTIPALLHRKNWKGSRRTTRKMLPWKHWPRCQWTTWQERKEKQPILELKNTRWRQLSFLSLSAFWATFKLNWRTNEPKWSHYMPVASQMQVVWNISTFL